MHEYVATIVCIRSRQLYKPHICVSSNSTILTRNYLHTFVPTQYAYNLYIIYLSGEIL